MKPNAPTHYVDTSVFIEALTAPRTDAGRFCLRYLARLGKIYEWVFGSPVIEEYYIFALQKAKNIADDLHDFFWNLYQDHSPIILFLNPTVLGKAEEVQKLDARLGFYDTLHLALAQDKVQAFVTIDNKILNSEKLRSLRVKVFHPADLL